MKKEQLPVIFKRYGNEVTALFPTIPGTNDPFTCTCYAHIGQHGSASEAYAAMRPAAKPSEYADLMAELRGIYDDCELVVRKRFHQSYLTTRRAELARMAA